MNKILKRIGTIALSAVMCLGIIGTAFAEDAIPRITFDNLREPQPDLYVTKSVSSIVDGYTAPTDAEFTFQLKWDANEDGIVEIASNVKYTLLDKNGTSLGEYYTDSRGYFTLQDGQYAYFEFVGQIKYEITEVLDKMPENFEQSTPAGGESATGTIPAYGTIVEFENSYIPYVETEETMLAVCKYISYPSGFESVNVDSEFEFTISIKGDTYGNQPYTVYDIDTHDEIERTLTESDGTFTIGIGQTAVFDGIETGVDYEVIETDTDGDGWRSIGTTRDAGSTVGPITYTSFTNEPTYFIVEKDRTDGITTVDDDFTFILTSDGETPMTNVSYIVYDINGNYVEEGVTTEQGEFTMKAGQKVLFVGLPEGTEYSIYETDKEGYNIDTNIESGKVSFDGNECIFTNEQLTNLTVEKVNGQATSRLLGGAKFELWQEVNDEYVYVGTYVTEDDKFSDSYGTFTLENMQPGSYKIIEVESPDGFSVSQEVTIITLPYTMTLEEIDENHINVGDDNFKGIWSEQDNCYYFYELTYDIANDMILVQMPNSSGTPWWPFAVIGAVIVGLGVCGYEYYRKHRTAKEAV